MRLTNVFLYTAAALLGIVISTYAYTHAMMQNLMVGSKLSAADECQDASVSPSANPNKMLFISCGGFLD